MTKPNRDFSYRSIGRRPRVLAAGATGLFVAALGFYTVATAEDHSAKKPPAPAAAAAKPAGPAPATPFAAVEQAKKAGAGCLPALTDISRITIDSGHTAVSTWNKDAPSQRSFSALNFLKYENQAVAPRSLALVTVTPTPGNHCDASSMRIQPSKLSCQEISAGLAKQNGPAPQPIDDVLMYPPTQSGQRVILMPAASGCVVVSTGSYYGP